MKSAGWIISLSTGIWLLLPGPFARAQQQVSPPLKLGLDSSIQSSPQYYGSDFLVGGDYRLPDADHVQLEARRLSRTYFGTSEVDDASMAAGYVWTNQKNMYWENRMVYSPTANFLPTALVATVPHYLISNFDFGLGMMWSTSPTLTAGTVNPSVLYQLNGQWMLQAATFIARTYDTIFAYQFGLKFQPSERQYLRALVAAGRTLEDVGIEVNFFSFNLIYSYALNQNFSLGPKYGSYQSDRRREDSFGLLFEVRP